MELLSVIVPCYNEEENVPYFYEEFCKNAGFLQEKQIDFEILYVDDGSKDGTVEEVRKLYEKDGRVRLLSFSRNFGKEAAMYAGLEKAKGDYVVIMDADLQDPPALLPEMFPIWNRATTPWPPEGLREKANRPSVPFLPDAFTA